MKEIKSIINAYNSIEFSTTKAALATVARVEGSSYRRMGARMLVLDNGQYLGGISGGCLEGDAKRRALKAIAQNKASIVTYDTTQDDGKEIGVGLGCNGIIDVLFTPLDVNDDHNPVRLLSGITSTREPRIIVSITGCDEKTDALGGTLLYENEQQFLQSFPLAHFAEKVLQDIHRCEFNKSSATFEYTTSSGNFIKVFVEVVIPITHLVIYGGNYDIYPLVRIANELGWEVTLVTNLQKVEKTLFTSVNKLIHDKGAEQPVIDQYTALVLMTHDYKTDYTNLKRVLATNARYIGMLGPRKRSNKIFDELQEEGIEINEENMHRIHAPAGLDIGADTPEEIALSIVAEIKTVFTQRKGASLRLKKGPIHIQ